MILRMESFIRRIKEWVDQDFIHFGAFDKFIKNDNKINRFVLEDGK